MRIAVSATGAAPGAEVDPRFGRCSCFVVLDTAELVIDAIANENKTADSGAGIRAAELMARSGGVTVLTGHCGVQALQALTAAGIEVVPHCSGTAVQALGNYLTERLLRTESLADATQPVSE